MSLGEAPVRIVVIGAGTSDPSTTRLLADRTAETTVTALRGSGHNATVRVIELAPIGAEIIQGLVSGFPSGPVQDAISFVAQADALIVATPVYKAGVSGLFKSFVDLLDNDLIVAKPVLLAATAGTGRHSMVIDDQLRPLFAFFRAMPAPTSVFAAPEDWASPELGRRIDRAAAELAVLTTSGVGRAIADAGWSRYQHSFGGNATRAAHSGDDIDLDTELMRLARGADGTPAQ